MKPTASLIRSPNSGPVRFGLIGTGSIAKKHAEALALIPEAKLMAVCGRMLGAAMEIAAPFGARATDSIQSLVEAEDIDAVLIATASGAHAEGALPFLRAGKHILCEKPLEVTTARARAMVEAAKLSGAILAGFFPLRYGAAAQQIKIALRENRFGRLTFLSARVKWWRELSYYQSSSWRGTWQWDGGGALMNQGIHAVDLLQWFGGRPVEVMAYAGTLAHPALEVEDTLSAAVRFENGALGAIAASTSCYPGLDLSVEVSGNRGTAVMENDRIAIWKFAEERPEDVDVRINKSEGQIGGGASDPRSISCEGHRRQILAFCHVLRGEPGEIIDGTEASMAVSIVETIYKSVRSMKSETIL